MCGCLLQPLTGDLAHNPCALTGNWTSDALIHRPASTQSRVTPARAHPDFLSLPTSDPPYIIIFLNYILLFMLLQLSQSYPFAPSAQSTPTLSRQPHTVVHVRGSCLHICSLATLFLVLYFTSPWLFCNYPFVLLNSCTFFAHSPKPLPSGDCQNIFYVCDSVLLVFLFCFLDPIVDRY